jgi:hypothetical protein
MQTSRRSCTTAPIGTGLSTAAAATSLTLTAPPVKQEWQLPPLPDEVLLHVFDYLDLSATVAALRVSRHWHELANDPRYPPLSKVPGGIIICTINYCLFICYLFVP